MKKASSILKAGKDMHQNVTILIVGVDTYVRRGLSTKFKECGFESIAVATGKDALDAARERGFNAVLLNTELPDIPGTDLIGPLKRACRDMSVIMVTTHPTLGTSVRSINEGAVGYISQPIKAREVVARIGNIIGNQQVTQQKTNRRRGYRQGRQGRSVAMIERTMDAVWVMDLDFKLTFVSPSVTKSRGYTLEELNALPLERHVTPKSFETLSGIIAEELTPQRLFNKNAAISRRMELEFYRKDKTTFWSDVVITLVRDTDGKPKEIIGIGRDITELKKKEETLARAAHEWRTTFDSITDLISIQDAEYRILRVSKSLADFLKVKPKDLVGKYCYEVIHGTKEPPEFCPQKRVFQTGKSVREDIFEPRFGMHLHLVDSPVFDENKQIVGAVHVIKDITERKHAEEALRKSEEKYRNIFDWAVEGIFQTTPEGRYINVNPAFARFLGYDSPEEMMEQVSDIGRQVYVDPRKREEIKKLLTEKGEVHNFEAELYRKDKSIIHVSVDAAAVRGEDGSILYYQGTMLDITDRKWAEQLVRVRMNLLEYAATHSLDELLRETLDEVGELVDSPIGFYHFVDEDQKSVSLQAWSTKTINEFCTAKGRGRHYPIDQAGVWVDCVYQRRPVIHNDYVALHDKKGIPAGHAEIRRELVVPIMRSEKIVAILGVGNKPADYTQQDISTVSYLADVAWEIAKRKRAEEALQESDIRFRKLSTHVPGVIYQFLRRPDGTFCVPFTSEAVRDIYGCSPDDVKEDFSPIASVIVPEDFDRVIDSINYSAEHMTVWQCEYRVQIPGQTVKWLYGHSTPEKLADGSIMWHGFNTDITERKRAEEKIQESQNRLLTTQRIAGVGSWDWDIMADRQVWSEETFRIFERDPGEGALSVSDALAAVHPDDRELIGREVQQCIEQDREYEQEYRVITLSGTVKYVHSLGEIVRDNDGKPTRFRGAVQDITEQKQAENEIQEASRALIESTIELRRSEKKWRNLFESSKDVIYLSTIEGKFLDINKAGENLFGYTRDELLKIKIKDLYEQPRNRDLLISEVRREGFVKDFETTFIKKDGTSVDCLITATAMENDAGEVIGLQGIIRDVTLWKRYQQQLEEQAEVLRLVNDSVITVDREGIIKNWNSGAERLLGYSAGEALGKNVEMIYPKEDYGSIRERIRKNLKKRSYFEDEQKLVKKDGSVIIAHITFVPKKDEDGKITGVIGSAMDITDRKRTEEALRESEEKYRSLVEDINDILFKVDTAGIITYMSPAVKGATGQDPDVYVGKSFAEFIHPDDLPRLIVSFENTLKGIIEEAEFRVVAGDGSFLHVRSLSNLIIEAGTVVGVAGLITNITERKKIEEALKKEQQDLSLILDSSPVIIFYINRAGKLIRVNRTFYEGLGRTEDEVVGKTISDIFGGDIARNMANDDEEVMKSGKPKLNIIQNYETAGGLRWLQSDKIPIFNDKSEVIGLVGFSQDITERKTIEEALRDSEEKFRNLFETSIDPIYITSLEGKLIEFNSALSLLSGYSPEELNNLNVNAFYVREEDRKILIKKIEDQGYIGAYELKLKKKGGEIIDAMVTIVPRKDRDGKIVGFQGITKDITERKRMEQQLLQSEKLSAVGTMISGVAHELNNPLTSIIGNAQLLSRRDVPDYIRAKLDVILRESRRSAKIVGGLLAFAREHKPERIMTDINEIVMESLRLREYDLKVSNIDVRTSLSGNLPETLVDPYQLQQVFINLINNARDALAGIERAALAIRTYRQDERIMVEFEDNGPGIPDDVIRKIFDPFFTTKDVGKGTGLGLSMAYGIVQQHDGTILAESRSGKGARFTVSLPITEGVQSPNYDAITPNRSTTSFRSVLVVEDEPPLRDLISEALVEKKYFVQTASTGEEAIRLIDTRKYDAVISDIRMPGIGGRELYLYIQKHHPEVANKVIFVTGDVLNRDTQSFLQITKNRFIEKPFNVDALITMLEDMLSV